MKRCYWLSFERLFCFFFAVEAYIYIYKKIHQFFFFSSHKLIPSWSSFRLNANSTRGIHHQVIYLLSVRAEGLLGDNLWTDFWKTGLCCTAVGCQCMVRLNCCQLDTHNLPEQRGNASQNVCGKKKADKAVNTNMLPHYNILTWNSRLGAVMFTLFYVKMAAEAKACSLFKYPAEPPHQYASF